MSHEIFINTLKNVLILYLPCIMFIFILPSLNQHLMHHLSYTNSHCLFNTPTCFGDRRRHLQGLPSQLLTCQHVKWFQITVGPCVAEMQSSLNDMPFLKLRGGRLDNWTSTKMHRSISQTA